MQDNSYPSTAPAYSTSPQQYYSQPYHGSPMMGKHDINTSNMIISSPQKAREYDQSLCGCFDDCGICVFGTFCGSCLTASNTYDLTQSCCAACLSFMFTPAGIIYNRIKVQEKYNIEESGWETCLAVLCCECANCQDAHEIHFQQKRAAAAAATIAAPMPIYAPNSYTPMYNDPIQQSAPYKA